MLANWRRNLRRLMMSGAKGRSTWGTCSKPRFKPQVLLLEDRIAPTATTHFRVVYGLENTQSGALNTLEIDAQTADNFSDLNYVGTVKVTSSDPGFAPLTHTFTVGANNDNGFWFVDVPLWTPGLQSITVTDSATSTITSTLDDITVTTATTHLAVAYATNATQNGAPNNLTVTALTAFNAIDTFYNGTITFSASAGETLVGTPPGYAFIPHDVVGADDGVHIFRGVSLSGVNSPPTFTISTTDGTNNGMSQAITVVPAGPHFSVVGFPSISPSGTTANITVTALTAGDATNAAYTGTVTLFSSDPLFVPPAPYTFTTGAGGDNGLHMFSVQLFSAGAQSITASDMVNVLNGSQVGIGITTATTQLQVTDFPSSTVAGEAHSITIKALTAGNTVDTAYNGTVTLTSSDPQIVGPAVDPLTYTFTLADKGVHTFNGVDLRTAGMQSISAHAIDTPSINGTESGIMVTPAAADAVVITTGLPSTVRAGVLNPFAVTFVDQWGNVATSFAEAVTLSVLNSTQVNFPATPYTYTAADAGVHTFNIGLGMVTQVGVMFATTGHLANSQTGIVVQPGDIASFQMVGLANAASGTSQNATVTAVDGFGNIKTDYAGTVQFSTTSPSASLPGTYTFTGSGNDNGTHVFTGIQLNTAGTQSVTVNDVAVTSASGSQTVVISPTGAGQANFVVSGFTPNPVVAGTAGTFSVTAVDSSGNVIPGYTGTVVFSSSDPQATFSPASYKFTGTGAGNDNGVHTFTLGVTLRTAGSQSVQVTDITTGATSTENDIIVTPEVGQVAGFAVFVTLLETPDVAGASRDVTVVATDAFGNKDLSYLGTVHFTSSDPQATLPADYQFTAADRGIHGFLAVLKTAGTQTITVNDTVLTNVTGQGTVVVPPGPLAQLVVSGFPSSVQVGDAHTFVVQATDLFGNQFNNYTGTVSFTSSDSQALLPASYTFTTGAGNDNGSHTFSATLKTAGSQSITATDNAFPTDTGSQTVTVGANPNPATQFSISAFNPDPVTAGQATTFTVTALDAMGNRATAYTGTVHFTSSDVAAILPADQLFTGSDAGAHVFSAKLLTPGNQTITVFDIVDLFHTSGTVTVTTQAVPATQFGISLFSPNPVTVGQSTTFTVTAMDAQGNTATSYRGTVHFTSTDAFVGPGAGLPADYQFTANDNGLHVFSVKLLTTGNQTITLTDVATGFNKTGTVTVTTPNPAAQFFVGGFFPNPVTAGQLTTFTIQALDALGHAATTYFGTVRFTSTDPLVAAGSGLPADYQFTANDNGQHVFSAKLLTPGSQMITVTDVVAGFHNSGTVSVVAPQPGQATHFSISAFIPNPVPAGQLSFTVTALDAQGNTASSYTGTVHFTSSDTQAVLPGNATLTNGTGFFTATLKTAGTQSLTATDTLTASITGSLSGITVIASLVARFDVFVSVFENPDSDNGTIWDVTAIAFDAFGNRNPSYLGKVHFTSTDPQVALPPDYQFKAADQGIHDFLAAFKTAGTQTITVTDTMLTNVTGQGTVVVPPGPLTQLVVSGFPSPVQAGAAHMFVVQPIDQFGNVIGNYTGTVHFTSSDAQAALPASYTFTTGAGGDNGAHTFTATLKTAGGQSITATDNANPTVTGTQTGINVQPFTATIRGTIFQDININGVQDAGETGMAGAMLFLDLDGSGTLKPADPTTITDANGTYQFTVSNPGIYTIREVLPPAMPPAIALGGVLLDSPADNANQVNVGSGTTITGINFANVPTSIAVPLTLPLTTPFLKQGNANADFVEAVYRTVLHRDAEPVGLGFWTNLLNTGALSRLQVVEGIRTSPEHFTQEVTDFYFTILNRPPDPSGLQAWVSQLQQGILTEEEVAFKFLDSPEYLSRGDKFFVDHMYLSLLGRTFDAPGEQFWLSQLGDDASGLATHLPALTHEQVITDFLRSPESLTRLVQGYYQIFLQRLADPDGLAFWLAGLRAGQSFLAIGQDFLASTEFYNKAAAEG